MIVVSDTTPIATLLKAGEAELLQKLFGSVIIPGAVAGELLAIHQPLPGFVTTGLLGLLVYAKQRNLILSVRAMIEVAEKKGGLYLSEAVKAEAARLAGE